MARLMIIDDDMMVSRYLEEHLTADGHEVKSYSMAEEGFQAAITTPPDLFLIDVMLPDATGFQMVGRFRQHPKTQNVPIIMMSGTARHANQKEIGKGMGADEYLVKPIDSAVVSDKIRHLLASKPKHATMAFVPQTQAPSPIPNPTPEPVRQAPPPRVSEVHPPVPVEAPQNGNSREDFALPEFEYADSKEPEVDAPPPVFEKPRAQKIALSPKTSWVGGMLVLHMALALAQGLMARQLLSEILRGVSAIVAGWALLLGLLVGVCAALQIMISVEEALSLLVWPAIPILGRAAAALAGFKVDPAFTTPEFYWVRPLDIFEMAAILILGISLRRKPGSSLGKSISVSLLIALGWCLTNRGYFHP